MASFPVVDGWAVPTEASRADALLVVASLPSGKRTFWVVPGGPDAARAIERFVDNKLRQTRTAALESEEAFSYFLLHRDTRSGELAVHEFGFGSSPSSPEEWPLVPLGELLTFALHAVLDQSPEDK